MAKPADTTNPIPRKCSVDGCDRKHTARGLCAKHYKRLRVYGTTELSRAENGAPEKFLRDLKGHKGGECILWPFALDKDGYGRIGCKQSGLESRTAHRLICIWEYGNPPFDGAEAAHRCGNERCVNPQHLRWASTLENNRERRAHGTMPVGEMIQTAKITAAQAKAIYADPRLQIDIASDYGVGQTFISKIKSGRTWAHATGHKPKAPRDRLDADTVRAIRASKASSSATANQYSISVPTVKRIRSGRAWKQIDG